MKLERLHSCSGDSSCFAFGMTSNWCPHISVIKFLTVNGNIVIVYTYIYCKKPLTQTNLSGYNKFCCKALRRVVRVVEGARLESVFTGNCNAGSNPAFSVKL